MLDGYLSRSDTMDRRFHVCVSWYLPRSDTMDRMFHVCVSWVPT